MPASASPFAVALEGAPPPLVRRHGYLNGQRRLDLYPTRWDAAFVQQRRNPVDPHPRLELVGGHLVGPAISISERNVST